MVRFIKNQTCLYLMDKFKQPLFTHRHALSFWILVLIRGYFNAVLPFLFFLVSIGKESSSNHCFFIYGFPPTSILSIRCDFEALGLFKWTRGSIIEMTPDPCCRRWGNPYFKKKCLVISPFNKECRE